mmetsp:Transcript_16152/g.50788  ORF Transcript_16152/g.50788 Transcript_16152/m.50788 type:complete len:211 (-) Transcript_16152:266-898(-)
MSVLASLASLVRRAASSRSFSCSLKDSSVRLSRPCRSAALISACWSLVCISSCCLEDSRRSASTTSLFALSSSSSHLLCFSSLASCCWSFAIARLALACEASASLTLPSSAALSLVRPTMRSRYIWMAACFSAISLFRCSTRETSFWLSTRSSPSSALHRSNSASRFTLARVEAWDSALASARALVVVSRLFAMRSRSDAVRPCSWARAV